jgi:hypothetical protein
MYISKPYQGTKDFYLVLWLLESSTCIFIFIFFWRVCVNTRLINLAFWLCLPFWLLGVIHYSPIKIIHYFLEYSLNTCYMLKLGTILVHWFIKFIWMLISPRNLSPYICTIVNTKKHCVLSQRRFFLSILGCISHIGHHPQEELTNFGYSLEENIKF